MVAAMELLVVLLAAYAAAGLLFGIAFAASGVERVDSLARGSGAGFRLMILPGAAALWPLLAKRWIGATGEPPAERNPHRDRAGAEP